MAFDLEQASDALLQFEAAALEDQRVLDAQVNLTGCDSVTRVSAQDGVGERVWIRAKGRVEVDYKATIALDRVRPDLAALDTLPLRQLPGQAVPYLIESRYCHPAQFIEFTQNEFGAVKGGGARVAAIRDWVAANTAYVPGASDSATTATDTFHAGAGICRDFAHLFVTLARACAIPARYVACYAAGVEPQDFHAVAQVYLANPAQGGAGAWHLIDATGMADPAETAIIGVGRDASDVSFLTSFDPMRFESSEVSVSYEQTASNARNQRATASLKQDELA